MEISDKSVTMTILYVANIVKMYSRTSEQSSTNLSPTCTSSAYGAVLQERQVNHSVKQNCAHTLLNTVSRTAKKPLVYH